MEKRVPRGLCPWPFSFLGTASCCSLVNARTARRSRTTERSESVSEEAEEPPPLHIYPDALAPHISHPPWRTSPDSSLVATY